MQRAADVPPPIVSTLTALARSSAAQLRVGGCDLPIDLSELPVERIASQLANRGVFSTNTLIERICSGIDIAAEAEALEVEVTQLAALYQRVLDTADPELLENVRRDLEHPRGLGQINIHDDDYERLRELWGINEIREVTRKEIGTWLKPELIPLLIPKGPLRAVDHRPFLGDARNQGGRPTCTAFGSTSVAEALEFFRDPRGGPRDFAEQLIFWYSKSGQLYTGGGYGCAAALRHHSEYGNCEEFFAPYNTRQLPTNHGQTPISDQAMDRAQFYRTGAVVAIPARDVEALKDVLRSGRCAGIIHDATDWNTTTGTYTMPDPLDSKGIGGNHCTSIIGFIDRDDLPESFEGGYFIQRNSWGGAGSPWHEMGPEYGGHLLMPYGWYRRYTHSAYTLEDKPGEPGHSEEWLAEFYENRDLQGAPVARATGQIQVLFLTIDVTRPVPQTVDEVDFDWGTGSALRYTLAPFGSVDLLPTNDFSARFTKVKRLRNGWYRFRLRGDDGVRLWVDDTLVINAWKNQAETEYVADHYVCGGDHVLRVEYYEASGRASVELDIEALPFHYDLFANDTLAGAPAATFDDTLTKLEWRHAPPVVGAPNGRFSLRGTGTLHFAGGEYRFHALHSGGCRIYLDNALVLDDWSGTNPTGPATTVSEGTHEVRVEFAHSDLPPAPGVKGYYRAALDFGWSRDWQASFYHDTVRENLPDGNEPDRPYRVWRTLTLTDSPEFERSYDVSHIGSGHYSSTTTDDRVSLGFHDANAFTADLPGGPDLSGNYRSAWFRRRVFLAEAGYYKVAFTGGAASRVVVSGKEVMEDHVGSTPRTERDIYLEAGVHDVAIEWSVSKWSKSLSFTLEPVVWAVTYYSDKTLGSSAGSATLDSVDRALAERPASVGSTNYSLRAKRNVYLPLGRYRFQVRGDDGVRLKINGITRIDGWTNQGLTPYDYELEHPGGTLGLEIEYYQDGGGSGLGFEFRQVGYFGEYYRGTTLQAPAAGATLDRNVPVAYRHEDSIDFDWGAGNRLDRVGANDFSARFRGQVSLPVGRWRMDLTGDDGIRLYVDGRLLIDEWHPQSATTHNRMIDLVGREHEIVVEYFERGGSAVCKLEYVRLY